MVTSESAERPHIHLIDSDADALTRLAIGHDARLPQLSALLLRNIAWATIHDAGDIASDIVTMHATVELHAHETGVRRTLHLVFPEEVDGSVGRVSILTPAGIVLIGRTEGQSVALPGHAGRVRMHRIVRVEQAPRKRRRAPFSGSTTKEKQ